MMSRLSLAAALLAASLFTAAKADAMCNTHPVIASGAYVNVDPGTGAVRRLHLSVPCPGGSGAAPGAATGGAIGQGGPLPWRLRMWGACHPTDCDWGWAIGQENTQRTRIGARYDQGFARRTVTIIPDGQELIVRIRSIYTDGRPPQNWVDRFRRD